MDRSFPEHFETDRISMQRLSPGDADGLFEAYKDPAHLRYMTFRAPRDRGEVLAYIEDSSRRWDAGDRKEYAMAWKESGEVLGSIGAYILKARVSLGIVVGPRWTQKGLAVEGLRGMIGVVQTMPWCSRIWAFCEVTHGISKKMALRSGFLEECVVRDWARFPNIDETSRDCRFFLYPKESR